MSRDGLLAAARLLTLRVGKGETASKTSGEEDEADEDWAPEFCNNALQGGTGQIRPRCEFDIAVAPAFRYGYTTVQSPISVSSLSIPNQTFVSLHASS